MAAVCMDCPEIVLTGNRCPLHAKARQAAVIAYRREDMDPRYGTRAWKRYSKVYRADHPVCALCGRVTEVVDHIKPVRERPDLFWEPTNHRPACHGCNRRAAVVSGRQGGESDV